MRTLILCGLLAAFVVGSAALPASAATWHIYADGSGDFPTITAAVAAATAGDSILVYEGTYNEHDIHVTKQLFIVGMGTGTNPIVDAQGLGRIFLVDAATPKISISGLLMQNGNSLGAPVNGNGGAALCRNGANVEFAACNFYQNTGAAGGAVAIEGGCTVTFFVCGFLDNDAVLLYGSAGYGGAISMGGYGIANPTVSIDWSLFSCNSAVTGGGALSMNYCQLSVSRCTFWSNDVTDAQAGQIEIQSDVYLTMNRNIVSSSACRGVIARLPLFTAAISCCDVYGNAAGNYGGFLSDQTGTNNNISADPLFCSTGCIGLFLISTISPCAPAHSPCGLLIGSGNTYCALGPNLVVDHVDWWFSTKQPTGTLIYATITVRNAGALDAGQFFVDFYRNRSTAPPPGLRGDSFGIIPGIPAGGTYAFQTATMTSDTIGEWQGWFQIDTDDEVLETNETDNSTSTILAWTPPEESGWPVAIGTPFHSSPVIASIDDDIMDLEVAVGCDNSKLYVLRHDGTNAAGFPVTLPAAIWSSPAVGNVYGDYRNEIVVGCDNGGIFAFDRHGAFLWQYKTGSPVRTTPALADLDGDGRLEIICASGSKIYALDGRGEPLKGWPYIEEVTFKGVAVGDVDWDGAPEIAATARVNEMVSKVYFFEANGELHSAAWPVQLDAAIEAGPAIGNLEMFPIRRNEIVVGTTAGHVFMLRTDGTIWSTIPQVTGSIESAPIIEDADGDGYLDIVVTSRIYALGGDPPEMRWNGYVTAINGSGSIMPGWPQAVGHWAIDVGPVASAAALGAAQNVMAGSPWWQFFSWLGTGAQTPAFPLDLAQAVITSAAAGDVDGDGWVELFIATNVGQVRCFELRAANFAASKLWWPMYGHDRARTFCYGFEVPTGVDDGASAPPLATALGAIYPNPFNPTTRIAFDLSAAGRVEIAVYDVSGRFVATLVDRELPAGRHETLWNGQTANGRAAASGIYFCALRAAGVSETKKIVLMR